MAGGYAQRNPPYENLVKLVTFPEQPVLDPFMGSGSTGVACLALQRKFVGFEVDEKYFGISQRRLGHHSR